ncbi:MAG TPA: GvpL/GvpF family gas vesicle protein, partial [Chloroflexota bacterium]
IELELRASYLVQEDAVDRLKTIASELAGKYAPLGYMFELTGPWPPFSFAGGLSEVLRGQWAAHD